ncbi:MAG: hypothetical protein RL585_2513 [Pseudomonadota bacterium]
MGIGFGEILRPFIDDLESCMNKQKSCLEGRRQVLISAAAIPLVALPSAPLFAQSYPTKTIRLICPFPRSRYRMPGAFSRTEQTAWYHRRRRKSSRGRRQRRPG